MALTALALSVLAFAVANPAAAARTRASEASRPTRVLLYGDSLTAGYGGSKKVAMRPYGVPLATELNTTLNFKTEVRSVGKIGWTSEEMLGRADGGAPRKARSGAGAGDPRAGELAFELSRASRKMDHSKTYTARGWSDTDVVVIWAGVNDLGHHFQHEHALWRSDPHGAGEIPFQAPPPPALGPRPRCPYQ